MIERIKRWLGLTSPPVRRIRPRLRDAPFPPEKYAQRPIPVDIRAAFKERAAQRQPPSDIFAALNVPTDATDDTVVRMLATDASAGHREWPTFDTPVGCNDSSSSYDKELSCDTNIYIGNN